MQPSDTEHSGTTIGNLPPHLQHLIFASAAAPLTTCKASAAITSDASLTAQWLLVKDEQPLLTAVEHGLLGVCDQLLGTHHYTPGCYEVCDALERAAGYGSTSVVSSLLQWCCEEHHQACATCESLGDALVNATNQGHVPVVSLLAQHPAITAQDARDAVCSAGRRGQLEVLQLLITARPDASDPQLRGTSPMCAAAEGGHVAAMQLLVQHGADVHNSRGSPWSSATAVSYLPAFAAAMWGKLEAVRWLHEQGVTDAEAGRALVAAARGGHVPVTQYLLQCGASLNVYGPDALKAALKGGHVEVVCLLLEAGTPTDDAASFIQAAQRCLRQVDSKQMNVIFQAATQHGHAQFAEVLKEVRATGRGLRAFSSSPALAVSLASRKHQPWMLVGGVGTGLLLSLLAARLLTSAKELLWPSAAFLSA
jgi:ankyrin repeat protein